MRIMRKLAKQKTANAAKPTKADYVAALGEYYEGELAGKRGALRAAMLKGKVKKTTLQTLIKGHENFASAKAALETRRPPGRPTVMPEHLEASPASLKIAV